MKNKKIYILLGFLFVFSVILFFIIRSNSESVSVIFLDVGQGDAILISKGTNQVVIDGGKNSKILLEKISNYIPFWDRDIELVIATHPDYDHIGGLVGLVRSYRVKNIIETDFDASSKAYKLWRKQIEEKGISVLKADEGIKINFDEINFAEIIFPSAGNNDSDPNANSIITKLNLEGGSFLLTGDLPLKGEGKLIRKKINLNSNYLKIGHHGSRTSTSKEFLEEVDPATAIISVGKNSYGHPHKEVLDRLKNKGIEILRTDKSGDIRFKCRKTCLVF